ncbi:response regulator transcription factor [Helicobacter cetorum]|uniref:Response regulator n=1 Tax=Helicobacter cetorum (strain ATCC BAA-429 / MIT 00-7128) TaxID=182217 RepID=I0EM43_HELC0|nr:response regulator [Helicobacter cetorum]AFI04012.1 response regulator [Helicobacter cetorum MIT 00-7128]
MKILIIEDDLALARSICHNLHDFGHACEIISSISQENKELYDVILVSSKVCTQGRCEHFVRYNSKQIIIMMASHVNEDGVSKPIQAGARDYILKPFKMDELLRKIQYHKAYQEMTARIGFYESYLDFIHAELPLPEHFPYKLPFLIHATSQNLADAYLLQYAKTKHIEFAFFSLKNATPKELYKNKEKFDRPYYITHLEELKKDEQLKLLELALSCPIVLSYTHKEPLDFPQIVNIEGENKPLALFNASQFLSLQEYEKEAIRHFSSTCTDTELANKLGISRKSLWEKRRKYNLPRK